MMCGAKALTLMLAMLACMAMTSCSSDDEEENGEDSTGEAAELSIPSSIVDGVRVSQITTDDGVTALQVTYNDDGSIDKAVYNGMEYDFEYADTRATSTGRRLAQVSASYLFTSGSTHKETWIANSFQFNTDGFLVTFKEHMTELDSDNENPHYYYDEAEYRNVYTLAYNSSSRLERVNLSSSWKDTYIYGDEKDTDSGNDSGAIKYEYNNGYLKQVKIESAYDDESFTWTFEYENMLSNTYNVMTPTLAEGMATFSPILYIFASMGYIGNASTLLPTELTYVGVTTDDDGKQDVDTYTKTVSYNFWDTNNKIKDITISQPGYNPYTYNFIYTK